MQKRIANQEITNLSNLGGGGGPQKPYVNVFKNEKFCKKFERIIYPQYKDLKFPKSMKTHSKSTFKWTILDLSTFGFKISTLWITIMIFERDILEKRVKIGLEIRTQWLWKRNTSIITLSFSRSQNVRNMKWVQIDI